MNPADLAFSGAVEGIIDEAIVRTILTHSGNHVGAIYVQGGKPRLLEKLRGFNAAAEFSPWFVLIDLNGDASCAPDFVTAVIPSPSRNMIFRVAVRQSEAWLMADAEKLASYLRISRAIIPNNPESEIDAKQTMVNLARRSRDRRVRDDMVPAEASGRKTGPNYAGRLIQFATQYWRPGTAVRRADSLRRCLSALSFDR